MEKFQMFDAGKILVAKLCTEFKLPRINHYVIGDRLWMFDECSYYIPTAEHSRRIFKRKFDDGPATFICIPKTKAVATNDDHSHSNWPGSFTDMTPYGVCLHELGHHVDYHLSLRDGFKVGQYFGGFSTMVRHTAQEKSITGFSSSSADWFAEMFRVYATNPNLLRKLRPKTFEVLLKYFPTSESNWKSRLLGNPPPRIIKMINQHILNRSN